MADVPYSPVGTQVPGGAINDSQNINVNPDQFGASAAAATENFGDRAQKLGQAFLSLNNETLAKEADIKFSSTINTMMNDPNNGYLTKMGRDAATSYPQFDQQLTQLYQNSRKGLSPEAQEMFDQVAVRRIQNAQENASTHAATENKRWHVNTAEARIGNEVNNSASSWGDDKLFNQSLATIAAEAHDRGSMLGEDDEQIKNDVTHYQSQAIQARIMATSENDLGGAQKLLDEYKDQLPVDARVQIQASLTPKIRNAQVRSTADNVISEADASYQNGIGQTAIPDVEGAIKKAIPGVTYTSDVRSPEKNAQVGGVPGSAHEDGRAIDFVPPTGTSLKDAAAKVNALGVPGLKAIVEGPGAAHSTGPHVHVQWTKGADASQYLSKADYYRTNYTQIVDAARTKAQSDHPDDPAYENSVVSRTATQMDTVIHQQELQYHADRDLVQQAVNGSYSNGKLPTTVEELTATNPQVKTAWDSVQMNDPAGAYALQTKMLSANSAGKSTTYGTNFSALIMRALAPGADSGRIYDPKSLYAMVGKGENAPLTNTGFQVLSGLIGKRNTPQGEAFAEQTRKFLQSAHGQISGANKAMSIGDPKGEALYSKFLLQAVPMIEALQAQGKTPAQIFDPKSPDYVGAYVGNFKRTFTEQMKDQIHDYTNPSVTTLPDLDSLGDDTARKSALQDAVRANPALRKAAEAEARKRGYIAPDAPAVPIGGQ